MSQTLRSDLTTAAPQPLATPPRRRRRGGVEARRALLEKASVVEAESWAAAWRAELRRQGRLAAGGWPGTVGEARARVAARFDRELRMSNMLALTHGEREDAAKAMYALAKRDWLANVEREARDDDPLPG